MLYQAYQLQYEWFGPMQDAARFGASLLTNPLWVPVHAPATRRLAAAWEVFSRLRLTHQRPSFGIDSVRVGEREVPVREVAVHREAFCTLQRFVRDDLGDVVDAARPKVLIVAPLSGHFATLLNDTARTMLPDHDVYITDWHNAREVPLSEGRFGLDEYVEHVIAFIERLGPGTHLVAVCQPCVPTLAAVALMAQANDPAQPRKKTAKVDEGICLGCGLCVRVCKPKSLRLASRPERVITPLNSAHKAVLMAIERGKLQNLIFDNQALASHRAMAAVVGVILRLPPLKQALASKQMKSRYLETLIARLRL